MNGSSYTEHVDFGDRISAGVVGKDQQFKVKIDGDTFSTSGSISAAVGAEDIFAAGRGVEYRSLPHFPHSIRGQAHASFSNLYER